MKILFPVGARYKGVASAELSVFCVMSSLSFTAWHVQTCWLQSGVSSNTS